MSSEIINAKTPSHKTICLWCGTPLDQTKSVKDSVCQNCYELLLRAGVPDEEIFNPKGKKMSRL